MTHITLDPHTGELFDTTEYRIPYPTADGHEITDLQLRITGNLKLNRNDPDTAALFQSLTLGAMRNLTITATVDGKHHTHRTDDQGHPTTTHTITLRIHDITE